MLYFIYIGDGDGDNNVEVRMMVSMVRMVESHSILFALSSNVSASSSVDRIPRLCGARTGWLWFFSDLDHHTKCW